jgi:hypothetical protein
MRHEKVIIKRDNQTVVHKTIAPWEIPLIEYMFDPGNIVQTGEFVQADQDYPTAVDEMARLSKIYGVDTKTDIPHAVSVYGTARVGVRALAKAIEAAKEEDAEDDGASPEVTTGARSVNRNRNNGRQRRPHLNDALLA